MHSVQEKPHKKHDRSKHVPMTYFQVPYLARVFSFSQKFARSQVVRTETLGGREVQEDKCFAYSDDSGNRQAYFMLDGFGGMAAVEFVKRNHVRVLNECDWDPVRTINQLDSELRVLALWSKNYRKNVLHYPKDRMAEVMKIYEDFKQCVIKQQTQNVDALINQYGLGQQKDDINEAIKLFKDVPSAEKKYLHVPLFEAVGSKFRNLATDQNEYDYEYRKKFARKIALKLMVEERCSKSNRNSKDVYEREKKSLKTLYKSDHKTTEEILQKVRLLMNPQSEAVHDFLIGDLRKEVLQKATPGEKNLFKKYENLILFNDQETRDRYKKSPEGNAFKLRCELIDEICDKMRDVWYPEAKTVEEMYQPLTDTTNAAAFKKLYPQYSDLHASFFTPFYRKEKTPIQEDIARGWKLLKFAATVQHLITGLPTSNPMQQEDLTEEQLKKWREDAEKLNIFADRDADDSGDLGELREDLGQLLNASQSALKHYVIRRVSDRVDRVPRFGEQGRAGSAIVLFLVDETKTQNKFTISWRGDCHALYQDEKGTLYNMNIGHKSTGGLSLEVGRFLGATAQEHHYKTNFSRETQRVSTYGTRVTKMVLMTDGAYNQWEKDKYVQFPDQDKEEEWNEKLEDLVWESRFHEGGSDNSTMMYISINTPSIPDD